MKLLCAWCQQEGVPAVLCEVEPLDDMTETHGICARHRFEVLQRAGHCLRAHGHLKKSMSEGWITLAEAAKAAWYEVC